jgi:hypothetical protein
MSTAGSPQGLDEAILRWAAPEEVEVRFAPAIRCPEASKGHRRVRCGPDVAGPFMLPWRPVMAMPDLFKVRMDPQVPPSCDTGYILDRLFGFRSRMSSPDSSHVSCLVRYVLHPHLLCGFYKSFALVDQESTSPFLQRHCRVLLRQQDAGLLASYEQDSSRASPAWASSTPARSTSSDSPVRSALFAIRNKTSETRAAASCSRCSRFSGSAM